MLIQDNNVISDSEAFAEIFGSFFSNAVRNLNIEEYFTDVDRLSHKKMDDPILIAIEKYKYHPSVQKIKECFSHEKKISFQETTLDEVIRERNNLVVTKGISVGFCST